MFDGDPWLTGSKPTAQPEAEAQYMVEQHHIAKAMSMKSCSHRGSARSFRCLDQCVRECRRHWQTDPHRGLCPITCRPNGMFSSCKTGRVTVGMPTREVGTVNSGSPVQSSPLAPRRAPIGDTDIDMIADHHRRCT